MLAKYLLFPGMMQQKNKMEVNDKQQRQKKTKTSKLYWGSNCIGCSKLNAKSKAERDHSCKGLYQKPLICWVEKALDLKNK